MIPCSGHSHLELRHPSLCLAIANLRTTRVKHQNVSRSFAGDSCCFTLGKASGQKACSISAPLGVLFGSRKSMKDMRLVKPLSAVDSNKVVTDSASTESENTERALTGDQLSAAKPMLSISATGNARAEVTTRDENASQMQGAAPEGLQTDSEDRVSSSSSQSMPKRSPLTAREKLRAARVLTRYTESKPSKREMGSNILDALRESDRGKTRGLPEAPTNLFDDSKRGMPKKGLTFDFPGGADLFVIIFSIVFISSVMFGTTYIVWKVGAIHFNEY